MYLESILFLLLLQIHSEVFVKLEQVGLNADQFKNALAVQLMFSPPA